MNQRSRIALLGSCLYFHLVAGTAIALGACSVRGGIDLTPPRVVIGTAPASSEGREIGPSSREDRPSSREDRPSSREDRRASAATDLRTNSPAAQHVVDIWKADLAKGDQWSSITQAKQKMQRECGCAPEFQPRWDDFAKAGNDALAGCPVSAVNGAADTLVTACRTAEKAKVCSKVKAISIQRGTPEGSCMNCMPINQITLEHGVLSYYCMEMEGMTMTGGRGKLAPLFD